jgi:transcriptional regulator
MYIPKHFQLKDEEIINDFIEKYSFATLFSQHNGEPYATHLPLTLNRVKVLYMVILPAQTNNGRI